MHILANDSTVFPAVEFSDVPKVCFENKEQCI